MTNIEQRNAAIPESLKLMPHWLTWGVVNDTKVPNGKANDPFTWHSFDRIKHHERIAYVFHESDSFTGIDLDDCIDKDGEFSAFGDEILELFHGKAYAETSPSGTGIKLWVRAKKPPNTRCKHGTMLEVYDSNRFFAVTGDVIGDYDDCRIDATKELHELCDRYLRNVVATQPSPKATFLLPSKSILSERLSEYASRFEPVHEGGRNHAAFNHAGNLRAILDEYGNHPSEEEIIDLMRQWNFTNSPPLDDDELLKVIRSSAHNGTARAIKHHEEQTQAECTLENIEEILANLWPESMERDEDSDEEFCKSIIPDCGLLRGVYDFYSEVCYRHSSVMGLAVAISLCETILGRRVRSQTDMRTNDYNLILAPTGSGKEACESTITKLLMAADASGSLQLPPDIQSGNGLMHAISLQPCSIWVCDEFGKILNAVLDKKGNLHIKNIGSHLLKLYGKASGVYGGAAHSDGVRNKVVQPHLVLLGLSTGSTVFSSVSTEQVSDGLIGRLAIFPVQTRQEAKEDMEIATPDPELVTRIRDWVQFTPGKGNLADLHPEPQVVTMTDEAWQRWKGHGRAIDTRMNEESESRAAVWARVAARSMKLALVHRCARFVSSPTLQSWESTFIEREDIDWGIKLANWLANIACSLVKENTVDTSIVKAKAILLRATAIAPVRATELYKACRSLTAGDFEAAAKELGLTVRVDKSGKGRPVKFYEKGREENE